VACLRVGGDERDEQRARLDLRADLRVPRVAAAQLVLIEPDLDAKAAQGGEDLVETCLRCGAELLVLVHVSIVSPATVLHHEGRP